MAWSNIVPFPVPSGLSCACDATMRLKIIFGLVALLKRELFCFFTLCLESFEITVIKMRSFTFLNQIRLQLSILCLRETVFTVSVEAFPSWSDKLLSCLAFVLGLK